MSTKPSHTGNPGFTPGPWELEKGVSDKHEQRVYGNVDGGPVALVEFTVAGGTLLDRGNARLIAAAPELLEALEKLLASATYGMEDDALNSPQVIAARAAIAKAKGTV